MPTGPLTTGLGDVAFDGTDGDNPPSPEDSVPGARGPKFRGMTKI